MGPLSRGYGNIYYESVQMNESAVSFTLVLISDWLAICVLCYLLVSLHVSSLSSGRRESPFAHVPNYQHSMNSVICWDTL